MSAIHISSASKKAIYLPRDSAIPVFLAMFLQAMYGAVDLLIVGNFAQSVDVSAVSTGSQIMMTITNLVTSFAMGTTILLGQRIGEGRGREGGNSVCGFV